MFNPNISLETKAWQKLFPSGMKQILNQNKNVNDNNQLEGKRVTKIPVK